ITAAEDEAALLRVVRCRSSLCKKRNRSARCRAQCRSRQGSPVELLRFTWRRAGPPRQRRRPTLRARIACPYWNGELDHRTAPWIYVPELGLLRRAGQRELQRQRRGTVAHLLLRERPANGFLRSEASDRHIQLLSA